MAHNLDKIISEIESQKEIISTLPVNTKKNRAIYSEKVSAIRDEYENLISIY